MMTRKHSALAVAALILLATTQTAQACSVCFGDPDSPMVQSAGAGILVLLGFIAFVLGSIVTVGGCWIVRARKLHAASENGPRRTWSECRGVGSELYGLPGS